MEQSGWFAEVAPAKLALVTGQSPAKTQRLAATWLPLLDWGCSVGGVPTLLEHWGDRAQQEQGPGPAPEQGSAGTVQQSLLPWTRALPCARRSQVGPGCPSPVTREGSAAARLPPREAQRFTASRPSTPLISNIVWLCRFCSSSSSPSLCFAVLGVDRGVCILSTAPHLCAAPQNEDAPPPG